jgi:hypothetical protein
MFYLILAIALLLVGLVAGFIVRFVRASAEKRTEMLRPRRKTILIFAGAVVAVFLATSAATLSILGLTSVRVSSAASDYLREQFGTRDHWSIQVSDHVERSKKPAAGSYHVHYHYGEKEGLLLAEYFEREGKLVFKFTPEDK